MKIIKLFPIIFLSTIAVFHLSCDDRTPTEDASSDYTLTMTTQPVAGNNYSGENVGEDILGDLVTTKISATIEDKNGNGIENALISFSSKKDNTPYGEIEPQSGNTDVNGQITVLFKDPGNEAAYGESKAVLKAEYAQNTSIYSQSLIDVFPDTIIWPYSLAITSSDDQIFKTTSPQATTLTIYVYNKLSNPVKSVPVDLTTTIGSFGDAKQKNYSVVTDELGRGTIIFNHNDELGLATISASYSHEGLDGTRSDTTQVLIGTNYDITLSRYPVSQDSLGNWLIVGEDVVGNKSITRLVATITDNSGNPIQGEEVLFTAEAQGINVGNITTQTDITNSQGQVFAYFDDNQNIYQDLGETEDFEGVTCTAYIGDITGESQAVQFSVFSESVWPYQLSLNTDLNEITLDNGATYATLNGRLLNGLSQPVNNVILSFTSNRGFLNSQITTDSNGDYTLVFRDLGEPSDIGLATIAAYFNHPGFNSKIEEFEYISIVTNYTMTLEKYPVSLNESGNPVLVGEDIAGTSAQTQIVVTVTDQAGNFIGGQAVFFSANVLGNQDVGSFDSSVYITNSQGKVFAYFLDDGNVYQDQSGTEDFEGVIVNAFLGDETGESQSVSFSVFGPTDVWPYQLTLNTDVEEITLDNGTTMAAISGRLLNGMNNAVSNVTLSFMADRGFINSQVTTDSIGDYSLSFQDLGEPTDVGLATISGSYSHPGFDSTITELEYVSIVTNYTLSLESYSVSLNESGNSVLVGEDLAGDNARTRIIATVTDASENPVEGQNLFFTANVLESSDVGAFEAGSFITNELGKVYVYFLDNGNVYQDQVGTQDYEGVTVRAYIGDETGENESVNFSVFDETVVWPYQLNLNTNIDEITLDNGQTVATITGELINNLNYPVQDVTLYLSTDKGFILPEIATDSTGIISTDFRDQGNQADVGMANIYCRYSHPGLSPEIVDSVQVFITTHYSITLEQLPVAVDENGNNFIVGEDVAGDQAKTLLIATVADTAGTAVPGVSLNFQVTDENGDNLGLVEYLNQSSDGDGRVQALFSDDGATHVDIPGSPSFEGVTVKVIYGGEEYQSVQFNVYDPNDVWPYSLFLTTNTDIIQLDAGQTQATIVARLLNGLSDPVKQAQLTYEASLGFISSFGETDTTGVDTVFFQDLGNPDEVGISDIFSGYSHPGFADPIVSNTLNISIEDTTFETCAYVTIPPSAIGEIMVNGGGGIESTIISAEVYDDDGILIDTPTEVQFVLGPNIPSGAHLENASSSDTVSAFTNNGIATVSLNSGTAPGPVRITAIVQCDSIEYSAVAVPVIIVTGPPHYIEAEWDPSSTEAIGGGMYRVQCAALVYDRHYNPVEDSTHVYWSIEQVLPCETPDVSISGTSLTYNANLQNNQYHGIAYTDLYYSSNGVGDEVKVVAYTWGDDLNGDGVLGDSVGTYINDGEGGIVGLPYINGGNAAVTITTSTTAHDFTLPFQTDSVLVMVSVGVYDYYGNEVINVPVSFSGIGVTNWFEVGFEAFEDVGIEGYGEGDGCFTWRDFGADGESETLDCGEGDYDHNSFDEDGNIRHWPHYDNELSEPFYDCGIDGLCPDDSGYPGIDAGEGDGTWTRGELFLDQNLNGEYDEGEIFNDDGQDGIADTDDYGEGDGICQPGEQYYDTDENGFWDAGEPFDDCGFDGLCPEDAGYPGPDAGEGDGQWYGYHMEGCGYPDVRVRTDESGVARILANLPKELCTFAGLSDVGDFTFCTYNQFTATINATLAIPVITPGDPVNIELSRTPFEADDDAGNCFE